MSWVWSLPLSPGGWKCSDSQFLLQYPSFLGACFSPIILLNFAFVHVRCLQWLLNKQINAIVFDSYGLDSASQTSSKVVYGRESYVSHPLFLAVFCCISNFSFLFFFFFYLIFLFYFLIHSFSFYFFHSLAFPKDALILPLASEKICFESPFIYTHLKSYKK